MMLCRCNLHSLNQLVMHHSQRRNNYAEIVIVVSLGNKTAYAHHNSKKIDIADFNVICFYMTY